MSALFLGLDVGTSGVKAILVAPGGDVVASATTPLRMSTPRPGWAEQDPEAWWQASVAALRDVLAQRPDDSVAAVGISGQMHSSVFLDRAGQVIRPALLWCDGRTTAECDEITRRAGGEDRLRDWVMNAALEGFTLPKVLWLRRHEPDAYARVATVLLAKDFIRYRLTGVLATEPSDASGTLMFDPARLRWSDELLAAVDVPRALLPDVGGSSDVLGRVTGEAAAACGLAEGTSVVGGGADNACGAAGVGVVAPGEAVASWGTSGTVLAPTARPVVDPGLRAHTFCHVVPNVWYVMGVVLSAGGAFSWYREQFARELASPGASARLDAEAASVPRGAEGVTFLPYLQGERTPHRDASARGALLGLSLAHTRAHTTRAVLEGVSFALRDSVSILQSLGLAPASLLLTGGGAKSPFVRTLQAEVYGLPVQTVNREEGPAYGAALLGAVGVGAFADLAAAGKATLTRSALEHPDPAAHRAYDDVYARFRASYAAAQPAAPSAQR
ncbi:xylulokinase [Gemmatirosa kalamazoonensis]|uniref:Xylulose kinase n=1 Tax=Gemmatirosa kalamazoonensis TaxID=861299 RepID=W0RMN1_9BACT|nr:xylulokinase [Gemmatirosa kalamazoonensis]AHG92041.1 xylulokinase [Gemmatirosa kalamazoonensis]